MNKWCSTYNPSLKFSYQRPPFATLLRWRVRRRSVIILEQEILRKLLGESSSVPEHDIYCSNDQQVHSMIVDGIYAVYVVLPGLDVFPGGSSFFF